MNLCNTRAYLCHAMFGMAEFISILEAAVLAKTALGSVCKPALMIGFLLVSRFGGRGVAPSHNKDKDVRNYLT